MIYHSTQSDEYLWVADLHGKQKKNKKLKHTRSEQKIDNISKNYN